MRHLISRKRPIIQFQKKNDITNARIITTGRIKAKHSVTSEAAINPKAEKAIKGTQHLQIQHLNLHPRSIRKCIDKKVRAPVAKIMAKTGTVAIISAKNKPSPVIMLIIMLGISSHLHFAHLPKNFFILKISPDFCFIFENSSRKKLLSVINMMVWGGLIQFSPGEKGERSI